MKEMNKAISIIIPCYNEERNIPHIVNEIDKNIEKLKYDYEFIFVDDGSTDNTYKTIMELSNRNDISVIKLSRNFGKEAAITVGLKHCNSDAAIIMDSDLQHPPNLMQAVIYEWEKGADIVDAVKIQRRKENIIKEIMSLAFNKIISLLTGMDFGGSSDYKLLDRKAINILNSINEKNRFFRGLTNWIGLQHSKIEFRVESRRFGKTKWNTFKLFRLSVDAMTSHTSKPLQIVTILGVFTLLFSIILGLQTLYNRFFGGAVTGFTTVILIVLILSSLIMISMGIMGVYLAKIYNEVKDRPLYVIDSLQTSKKTSKTSEE
jgi:dolichol-phosphate mannosyltransferase